MRFQLNFKSGKPVYLQLVDQVKAAAASGAVRPGEPLPVASGRWPRSCASTATPSPRPTAELESQGVIETIAGKGCFVRGEQLAVQERSAAQAPGRDDRRRRRPGPSPAGRPEPNSSRLVEERLDAFERQAARAANR